MADFSIGVDLGGTNLCIAAADQSGTLLEKIPLTTQVSRGRDYVMDEMCAAIRSLAARLQPSGKLLGIGVGVPGMVDQRTGYLVEYDATAKMFSNPSDERTENYITGRFG